MKKPVRLLIYMGILGLTWFIFSPALSINSNKIGGPIKGQVNNLLNDLNTATLAGLTVALALGITYLITSGWGLILLGIFALCGLVVLGIFHPYLFPLLVPLSALWVACAVARRKESAAKNT